MIIEFDHPREARFRKEQGGASEEFADVPTNEIPEEFTRELKG